jgi:hypothetical protein
LHVCEHAPAKFGSHEVPGRGWRAFPVEVCSRVTRATGMS